MSGWVWLLIVLGGPGVVVGAVAAIRHGLRQQRSGPDANKLGRAERQWRDD